jgi:hypothetical protein
VALPFVLTVGSLIFLLVATLGGVANTNLYMFQVNLTDLSINPAQLPSLNFRSIILTEADVAGSLPVLGARDSVEWHDKRVLAERKGKSSGSGSSSTGTTQAATASGSNVTAADLGLANLYDVSLWGYCRTGQDGTRTCTKAQFNWAEATVNGTANDLQNLASAATGQKITIPKQITDAVQAFATLAKWTEIAFIAALICLGVELFFGIFATCSRAWSCVTFIVASITSIIVVAAAALATTMSVLVVGTVEGTARWYGVDSSFNTSFLALIWLAAALALGAGFFWMFTVCCCAPSHGSSKKSKRHAGDAEKLLPTGAYQPLHEPEHNAGYYNNASAPVYGAPRYPTNAPRSDIAYEPYSHRV